MATRKKRRTTCFARCTYSVKIGRTTHVFTTQSAATANVRKMRKAHPTKKVVLKATCIGVTAAGRPCKRKMTAHGKRAEKPSTRAKRILAVKPRGRR